MDTAVLQKMISELAGAKATTRPPTMTTRLDEYVSHANSEAVVIHPDIVRQLRFICERIDSESDSDVAWAFVEQIQLIADKRQLEEMKHAQRAVAENLVSHTLAYIDTQSDIAEIASGTLVAVGDRCFLITAAHSIPNRLKGRLAFVGKHKALFSEVAEILSAGKEDSDGPKDVGYLELDPVYLAERLGKSPIELARILPVGSGSKERWTFVAGYPSEVVASKDDLKVFTMHTWGNILLTADEWGVLSTKRRSPDPELDVFIPYPRDEPILSMGSQTYGGKLPEPFGMSGGGYWQRIPGSTGLWTPESYGIIAVQSRWWGRGRYLQGTQIIHWLRLLHRDVASVRQELESHFPQLKDV